MTEREPMNFSWFVEEKVAGLACPSDDGVTFLANQGIKTIINLADRPRVPRYTEKAKILGIHVEAIPIIEFTAPTTQQIERFVQILTSAAEPVAVHCRAGYGRTGTMLACYLVAAEGYSAADAITETRRRRSWSIETEQQEQAVFDFEKNLKEKYMLQPSVLKDTGS